MLEAQYQKYKDHGLVTLTLMVDGGAMDLRGWSDSYHLSFPVMWDDYSLFAVWGTGITPTQHLIGPGSVIIETNSHFNDDYLEDLLDM